MHCISGLYSKRKQKINEQQRLQQIYDQKYRQGNNTYDDYRQENQGRANLSAAPPNLYLNQYNSQQAYGNQYNQLQAQPQQDVQSTFPYNQQQYTNTNAEIIARTNQLFTEGREKGQQILTQMVENLVQNEVLKAIQKTLNERLTYQTLAYGNILFVFLPIYYSGRFSFLYYVIESIDQGDIVEIENRALRQDFFVEKFQPNFLSSKVKFVPQISTLQRELKYQGLKDTFIQAMRDRDLIATWREVTCYPRYVGVQDRVQIIFINGTLSQNGKIKQQGLKQNLVEQYKLQQQQQILDDHAEDDTLFTNRQDENFLENEEGGGKKKRKSKNQKKREKEMLEQDLQQQQQQDLQNIDNLQQQQFQSQSMPVQNEIQEVPQGQPELANV